MTVEIEKFTPEMIESFERLNLFWHVHHMNEQILDVVMNLVDSLREHPGQTLTNETLVEFASTVGYQNQSIDALMHILQKKHVGEALEYAKNLTDEEKIYIRDNLHTEDLNTMLEVLTESEEERTQRMLLEHLHLHD